jgi:Ca2+-binding RTX toxin-like protein
VHRGDRGGASFAMAEDLEDRTLLTTVLVDYSLDTNNFFDTQEKMDLFQTAVDNLAGRLTDSLLEISASGPNTWSARFDHPGTGASHSITDPVIPADTIIIYAGGRDLPGSTIGFASTGFSAGGTSAWLDLVEGRGQSGAVASPATDFATWGGSITFDNMTDWHFGLTTDGLDSHESDFLSVAEHELAHILGFGSDSWDAQISGGFFTGANAVAVHGGPVPVTGGHWADDTMSDGREANLTPTGTSGTRYQFTSLDFAGLEDIGWVLSDPPSEIDYGDAPDTGAGTGAGNYQTLASDTGPSHTIVSGLFLGASVDGDDGTLQNVLANADDVDAALPDDEDGVQNPLNLRGTIGTEPKVTLLATNTTGSAATLSGWIDYNQNGSFDNSLERAQITVPDGTVDGRFTLTFQAIPDGSIGTTYARFRLSTDAAAENSTGAASDGEVEDHRFSITAPQDVSVKDFVKIADDRGGFPLGELGFGDGFGTTVASIGDLDGDGITDLAVGMPRKDFATFALGGDPPTGAVYVLLMNSNGTVKSTRNISDGLNGGPLLSDYGAFGSALAGPGDLDGDGIPDLAVGDPGDDTGGDAYSNRGAVYLLFMNSNGTVKSSSKIASGTGGGPVLPDSSLFGGAIAFPGDIDGDGVQDMAVGAANESNTGTVNILFMNPNGTVKSSTRIASGVGGGPALGTTRSFGYSLAPIGDLDGDGISDLAVGAPLDGNNYGGHVYLLMLNADGTAKNLTTINPVEDRFGTSLAALGDLDGDGVNDLAVGAPDFDVNGGVTRGGIVFLFLNSDGTFKFGDLNGIANELNGGPTLSDQDHFGTSVTALGDIDGDGALDLAVGAIGDDTGGPELEALADFGAVYVLRLGPTPDLDFGDAPDSFGTTMGSNGARHVTTGPLLGVLRDSETDAQSPLDGSGDDVTILDDEDGLVDVADLTGTEGFAPAVRLLATNMTGSEATLFGWIDYNGDGVFDNATERGQVTVPNGADGQEFTVTFPVISADAAASTYARFRLSTDVAAAEPMGLAADGEVEDYVFSIDEGQTAEPVDVMLPGAASYEVLRDGADLVVRVEGGSELSRDVAALVSVLRITGSAGDDVVTVLDTGIPVDTPIVFTGGDGNDRFDASLATGAVNLTGNGGDDVLIGGSANDTLNGGSGKDELIGNTGDDLVQGQGSTGDTLDGGDGNDTLNGGSGNDLIRETFTGNATLTNSAMTGRGNDTVVDAERAELTGGGAAQTIDVSAFFTAGLTSVTLDGGGGDDVLLGSDGSDVLVGSGGSDRIEGNAGNDRMIGGSGADTLIGGAGDDLLKGLGGSGDRLSGGDGNDTLNGGRGIDRVIETGDVDFTLTTISLTGLGTDVVQAIEVAELNGGDSDNVIDVSVFVGFKGFTQLRGNGGNDLLIGSAMGDVLNGGDGNDTLLGKAGDDTLNGEDGNDGLSGFTGDDVINGGRGFDRGFGGQGNDSLLGGNAVDTLIGGEGDDTIDGNDGTDTLVGGTGNNDASSGDVINDGTANIDEAFMLDPLPGWVDQV